MLTSGHLVVWLHQWLYIICLHCLIVPLYIVGVYVCVCVCVCVCIAIITIVDLFAFTIKWLGKYSTNIRTNIGLSLLPLDTCGDGPTGASTIIEPRI